MKTPKKGKKVPKKPVKKESSSEEEEEEEEMEVEVSVKFKDLLFNF